mmetsp:Transcript_122670/g.183524  ORF Transcript_122670/g.183524 Transcript_122670/m.183524 type:complete len:224 (-) Transcript_122670:133-804(-)
MSQRFDLIGDGTSKEVVLVQLQRRNETVFVALDTQEDFLVGACGLKFGKPVAVILCRQKVEVIIPLRSVEVIKQSDKDESFHETLCCFGRSGVIHLEVVSIGNEHGSLMLGKGRILQRRERRNTKVEKELDNFFAACRYFDGLFVFVTLRKSDDNAPQAGYHEKNQGANDESLLFRLGGWEGREIGLGFFHRWELVMDIVCVLVFISRRMLDIIFIFIGSSVE